MAKVTPFRDVRCYHCSRDVQVPETARSATCPLCFKGLVLDDVSVTEGGYGRAIATCGIVTVEKKARVITKHVEAGIGLEVLGHLEAKKTVAKTVLVGPKGVLKGEVETDRLWVDKGGSMDAYVRIGVKPQPEPHETEAEGDAQDEVVEDEAPQRGETPNHAPRATLTPGPARRAG